MQMHEGVALDDRPGHLADIIALGRFDLDDISSEVGEVSRDTGGAEHGALDHPHTGERRRLRIRHKYFLFVGWRSGECGSAALADPAQ